MQRRTPKTVGAVLAIALSTAGCQATTPAGGAQPPMLTASPSPELSTSPTPSEAMTAGFKVSDVQEAERVYREFIESFWLATEIWFFPPD